MSWVRSSQRAENYRSVEHFLGGVEGQESTSRKRGYLGVLSLIAGGFLIYTSLPYASAFFDIGQIVGISQIDRKVDEITETVIQREYYKKVYLRAGQSLTAQYAMPANSELVLELKQCRNRPIIEAFKCSPIAAQTIRINTPSNGQYQVVVDQAGFYNFGDALRSQGSDEMKYKLIWQRT